MINYEEIDVPIIIKNDINATVYQKFIISEPKSIYSSVMIHFNVIGNNKHENQYINIEASKCLRKVFITANS